MNPGEDRFRRLLRRLARTRSGSPARRGGGTGTLPNGTDPYLASRLDAIEVQLRTLNRLLAGSLLTLIADLVSQVVSK